MERPLDVPAFEIEPRNATGSGDVFNAALVHALAEGKDLLDAVRFANAAGALRVAGGCLTFPTVEQIQDLMDKGD
jgi:sugar/nucleoside kinase (ribokinase family)